MDSPEPAKKRGHQEPIDQPRFDLGTQMKSSQALGSVDDLNQEPNQKETNDCLDLNQQLI